MKIVYVANHNQRTSNNDEGALSHALRELGHDVLCIPESGRATRRLPDADLLFFHKYSDIDAIRRFTGKRAFFYFDLVSWSGDRTLGNRCTARRQWMSRITPLVDVGFCTDGDHVAQDTSGKLVWLPQGADELIAGHTPPVDGKQDIDILFTGIAKGGGVARESFVAEMRAKWGERFVHVPRGVHGAALRAMIGRAKIVVAPDSPVTPFYHSNRLYLTLGFGGFLLHPYTGAALCKQYTDRQEIVYYHSRTHLHELIEDMLEHEDYRRSVASAGLARTLREHLYRHRVERMLGVMKERGLTDGV